MVTVDGKLVVAEESQFGDLFYQFNAQSKLDPTFAGDGRLEQADASELLLFTPTLLALPQGGFVAWGEGTQDDQDGIAIVQTMIDRNGKGFARFDVTDQDETGDGRVRVLPDGSVEFGYDHFLTEIDRALLESPAGKITFSVPADAFLPKGNGVDFARIDRLVPVGHSGAVVSGYGEYFDSDGLPVDVNFVARLKADGAFDKTFGKGGILSRSIPVFAAQSDGKILYFNSTATELKRLDQSGNADRFFGTNGIAAAGYDHFSLDSHDRIIAWKIRKDGGIQIARFTANGKPDKSFSGDGQVIVHLPVKGDVNLMVTPKDDLVVTSLMRSSNVVKWSAKRILCLNPVLVERCGRWQM